MKKFDVQWIDGKREPKEQPDPRYPLGMDLDISQAAVSSCKVDLPYPAKRCGFYVIECNLCRFKTVVTTAGRPDDPRSVRVPCKLN